MTLAVAYSQSASIDHVVEDSGANDNDEPFVFVEGGSVEHGNIVASVHVDGSAGIGNLADPLASQHTEDVQGGKGKEWKESAADEVPWEEDEDEYVGLHDEQPYMYE